MNTNQIILNAENVSKKFCRNLKQSLFYGLTDILKEVTLTPRSNVLRKNEFFALNNVSFQLERGDAIGLIGENGSGKTTLLKIISGLIKPDSGGIKVKGRLVPLLALGAGFKPILTGRENIYVNLSILGLKKNEIESLYEDIVNFAEIGDAIDAPVQSYSSGMAARLGFSCAVHSKADILLIDEVLSVGDMRFRSKCYRKLAELRDKGTSFILVSHNTNAILSMCNKAVYLKKGKQILSGDPATVMAKFEEDLAIKPNQKIGHLEIPEKVSLEDTGLQITQVSLKDSLNQDIEALKTSTYGAIQLKIKSKNLFKEVMLSVLIRELTGESEVIQRINSDDTDVYFDFSRGVYLVNLAFPKCSLRPGVYTAKFSLHQKPFYVLDAIESYVFSVSSDKNMFQCQFYQEIVWNKYEEQGAN